MSTCNTEGITVTVETQYLPAHSDARCEKHVFGYFISIYNGSAEPVQLLARHWIISECDGTVREVRGEGVVGQQPIIAPGAKHEYTSFCNLSTEVGKMHGTYLMKNLLTNHFLYIAIPAFHMVSPAKMN